MRKTSLILLRFCGQDEEHDPGEEFEEYLACSVCGDNGEYHASLLLQRPSLCSVALLMELAGLIYLIQLVF